MSDPIIEAAARALRKADDADNLPIAGGHHYTFQAEAIVAAVTPLIRAAALEEAAKVADDVDRDVAGRNSATWSVGYFARHIQGTAAAIRALKKP